MGKNGEPMIHFLQQQFQVRRAIWQMNRLELTRDPKNLKKVLYRRTGSENSKISWKKI